MHTVYFDSNASDALRRQQLYGGQLFVFSPRPSTRALCELARQMIEEAFGSIDPLKAQYHMSVEEYVAIVAPLKPKFIHHPETKRLIRNVLADLGCDLEKTYQDVPRLRMVTSHGYLTSGVGYAHHPHRDTWYSAPMCQLNWWIPVYGIESECSMAFHPRYWNRPVRNSSDKFNYYRWNSEGRAQAAQHIKSDTRQQPKPLEEVELEPQIRLITEPGGIVLFSAAQLHSTVPNTSGFARYSMDFRTVHYDDVVAKGGAANIDSACTGTSLRDFVRSSDLAQLPEEIVSLYDQGAPVEGALVFRPENAVVAGRTTGS
jgi:hypothetical protein